jgi:steroid delta-isomerase-like uncharacterized protein
MSDRNKALVRRMKREAIYKRNFAALDKLLTDDFVNHDPLPGTTPDIAGFKEAITHIRTAFPDLALQRMSSIAEGDKVVEAWTVTGTHRGEFMGVPPSGARVSFTGMELWRIAEGGKIAERWGAVDRLDMFVKAGLARAVDGARAAA